VFGRSHRRRRGLHRLHFETRSLDGTVQKPLAVEVVLGRRGKVTSIELPEEILEREIAWFESRGL